MLLSSLNTGNTDLRDTDVQQPNTAATLSLVMSSRAFSANSGQFEAGSTTTASSFLPSTPPFLFCSSMSMSMTSFSVVSLIAMVPERECRMPTLIVSWARAGSAAARPSASPAVAASKWRASGRWATAPRGVCIAMSFCLTASGTVAHRSHRQNRKRRANPAQGLNVCVNKAICASLCVPAGELAGIRRRNRRMPSI